MSFIPRALNSELTLLPSGRVLKNRLCKAPTSEATATYDQDDALATGIPTPIIINAYEKWAAGQWGLIVTGGICIDNFGINFLPGNMWIGESEDCPIRRKAFSELAKRVHSYHGTLIGQVLNIEDQAAYLKAGSHAGAKHLARTIFAAKYLAESGFDGIELAVPEPPKDEETGLPLLHRVLELIDFTQTIIRTALPWQIAEKFVIGLKVSTARLQQGGVDMTGIIRVLQQAESSRYDYISIAGGSYETPLKSAESREHLYRRVINEAREYLGQDISVYGIGGFRSVPLMDSLVYSRTLSGVGMAKPACAEFDFPVNVLHHRVQATLKNPYEYDNDTGVLAATAQLQQAGSKNIMESEGSVNDGIMDLTTRHAVKRIDKVRKRRQVGVSQTGANGPRRFGAYLSVVQFRSSVLNVVCKIPRMLLSASILALLLAALIAPFTAIFLCSKKKQLPGSSTTGTNGAANNGGGLKSKRCNRSAGLGNDDPDLIKSDRGVAGTNETKPSDKVAEFSAPVQPPTDANSKMGQAGKNKPTPSREQTLVSKEQCDTDLRSFLSEVQKNGGGGKPEKAKKENKSNDKADKPPSLAATQEVMSKEGVGKKQPDKKASDNSKERHNKPKVEPTQNESIKTVADEPKVEPGAATAMPTPVKEEKKEKSTMSAVGGGDGGCKIQSEHPMPGVPQVDGAASKYMGP
uniref:Oxidored_FMN domain-containing protein n=1 Tax=Panagrellus redivivus TaxID=6233 RepID=A0A7E4VK15_PANRE